MSNNNNHLCVNDFEKICRTCLAEGEMKFLFEKCPKEVCLIEMLTSITFIQFSEKDGLPVQICLNCEAELTRAYRFAQKCAEVDKKLKTCIKKFESNVNNEAKFISSQAVILNSKTSTENNEFQIKTDVEAEEAHKNDIKPEFIEIKPEILPEKENNYKIDENLSKSNHFNNENLTLNEIDHNNDSDFDYENNFSDSNIDDKTEKQPINKVKQKIPKTKAGGPYECKACSEKFPTYKLLKLHWKEVKHPNRENCKICSKSITSYNMNQHMRIHRGEKRVFCEICGKGFFTTSKLNAHRMTHTGEKPYKCNVCDKAFTQSATLQTHLRIHTGEKPFICDHCGEGFRSNELLKQHLFSHNTGTPGPSVLPQHECETCHRKFTTKYILKKHILTHGEKTFLCNYCGQSFISKAVLECHIRVHTSEKPYSCQICGKTFRQCSALRNHTLSHTGEKTYICKICNRGFMRSQQLTRHLRTHSGEKPYSCDFCGKKFSMKINLTVHTRIHTGETPYLCPICNKGFRDSSSMKKHKRCHEKETTLQ